MSFLSLSLPIEVDNSVLTLTLFTEAIRKGFVSLLVCFQTPAETGVCLKSHFP